MRVCVAGASAEIDEVARLIARLKVEVPGVLITHDWLTPVFDARRRGCTDADLSPANRLAHARADWDGVVAADLVWLLAPAPGNTSTGCWVELGMALEHQRHVSPSKRVLVSGDASRTIFAALASAQVATHEEAVAWIARHARLRGGNLSRAARGD